MKIEQISLALLMVATSVLYVATAAASDKPIQHLQLADVTSYEDARAVFTETTSELKGKNELDADQLHEIHIITYSLEKAVAYFTQNMKGDQQVAATKMAKLVESIHIGSENNLAEETQTYLDQYFKFADAFAEEL